MRPKIARGFLQWRVGTLEKERNHKGQADHEYGSAEQFLMGGSSHDGRTLAGGAGTKEKAKSTPLPHLPRKRG